MSYRRGPHTDFFLSSSGRAMIKRFPQLGQLRRLYGAEHPVSRAFVEWVDSLNELRGDLHSSKKNAIVQAKLKNFLNLFDAREFKQKFPDEKQLLSYITWMKGKGEVFVVDLMVKALFPYVDRSRYSSLMALVEAEEKAIIPETKVETISTRFLEDSLILQMLENMRNGTQAVSFSAGLMPSTMFDKLVALYELFQLYVDLTPSGVIAPAHDIEELFNCLRELIKSMLTVSSKQGEEKQAFEQGVSLSQQLMKLIASNEKVLIQICDQTRRKEAKAAIEYFAAFCQLQDKLQPEERQAFYQQMKNQMTARPEHVQSGGTYPGFDEIIKQADRIYAGITNKTYLRQESTESTRVINIYNPTELANLQKQISGEDNLYLDGSKQRIDRQMEKFVGIVEKAYDSFIATGAFAKSTVNWDYISKVHETEIQSRTKSIDLTIQRYCDRQALVKYQRDEGEKNQASGKIMSTNTSQDNAQLKKYFRDAALYKKNAQEAICIALRHETLLMSEMLPVCQRWKVDPRKVFEEVFWIKEHAEERMSKEFKEHSESFYALLYVCRDLGVDPNKVIGLKEHLSSAVARLEKDGGYNQLLAGISSDGLLDLLMIPPAVVDSDMITMLKRLENALVQLASQRTHLDESKEGSQTPPPAPRP